VALTARAWAGANLPRWGGIDAIDIAA